MTRDVHKAHGCHRLDELSFLRSDATDVDWYISLTADFHIDKDVHPSVKYFLSLYQGIGTPTTIGRVRGAKEPSNEATPSLSGISLSMVSSWSNSKALSLT